MKQVGIIMFYYTYKEYQADRREMYDGGYACMDWIPGGMDISYLQFIRYRLETIQD
jgi:hypothetical protein